MIAHQHSSPPTAQCAPVQCIDLSRYKKRVSFKPTITVQPIKSLSSQEEKSNLYYSAVEMKSFSQEVKDIHQERKQMVCDDSPCGVHATKQECMVGLEADPALRGLGLHLCAIRLRSKLFVWKTMIEYQKCLNSDCTKSEEEESFNQQGWAPS